MSQLLKTAMVRMSVPLARICYNGIPNSVFSLKNLVLGIMNNGFVRHILKIVSSKSITFLVHLSEVYKRYGYMLAAICLLRAIYYKFAKRRHRLIKDVVTECIDGFLDSNTDIGYLEGYPQTKVLVRPDFSSDRVAVISGGGSGHEPAHAGFVGKGMLTAAICGNVFASPRADAILAGIRAVTGPKGCLLIVKNYTGYRLNFGLAAEEAKAEGYKVEMVIVGDDCALPPPRCVAGRRGLAGTILVHKVAGAASEALLSLEEVAAEAQNASELVGTMCVCTLPGQVTSDRLGPGKMELGLGIHGEPGAAVADLQPVDVIISHVLEQILSKETNYVPITRGSRVVLMINGLGATPSRELMIVTGKAVSKLQLVHGLVVEKVYTGSFMTSLDMAGFSISIMRVDTIIMDRLTSPTNAPYWPVDVEGPPNAPVPVMLPIEPQRSVRVSIRPEILSVQGLMLVAVIKAAAKSLINSRGIINDWDRIVGDGDCGSTMSRGATAILDDMNKHYPLNDAVETVNEIGCSIQRVMGGTTGTMYCIFFKAAYAKLKNNSTDECTYKQWADAFDTAIDSLTNYGGAQTGFCTLLDAFIPASAVLKEKLNEGVDPLDAFIQSASAAFHAAESTKHVPGAVPDPGAMAAAIWYSAAALALKERKVELSLLT